MVFDDDIGDSGLAEFGRQQRCQLLELGGTTFDSGYLDDLGK